MNLKALTEAILFAIGDAVSVDEICIAAGDENKKASAQDIKDILKELANDYENENRGIRLIELNGKYQLCTKKDYYNALIRIVNMPEKHTLTDVLLETLSIVAYKQPVTRAEIEKIRGVSCSHAINRLIEYNLVDEVGRLDAPGHPILFGTTDEFLRSFGISSMDELPDVSQDKVADFRKEAEEEAGVKVET